MLRKLNKPSMAIRFALKRNFSSVAPKSPIKQTVQGNSWGLLALFSFAIGVNLIGYQAAEKYETSIEAREKVQKVSPELGTTLESMANFYRQFGLMASPPKVAKADKTIEAKAKVEVVPVEPPRIIEEEKAPEAVSESTPLTPNPPEVVVESTPRIPVLESQAQAVPESTVEEIAIVEERVEEVAVEHHTASIEFDHSSTHLNSGHTVSASVEIEHDIRSSPSVHSPEVNHVQSSHSTAPSSDLPVVEAESRAQHVHSEASDLALNEHAQYSAALRKEVEASILRDLDNLDAEALRRRLNMLASELLDRASWEGVRLHEAAKIVETDLVRKFSDLLEAQRVELEKEKSAKIISREIEIAQALSTQSQDGLVRFEKQLHDTLRSQFDHLHAEFQRELKLQAETQELENKVDNLFLLASTKKAHIDQLMVLQEQIMGIGATLSALGRVSSTMEEQNQTIHKTHQQNAALSALEFALRSSRPVASEIATVQNVFNGPQHEFVETILRTLPEEAPSVGVPTLLELRARFKTVREEVRKAAMAPPDAPQIVGQLVGTALATISKPPEGMVRGNGVEEILARVTCHLENGRLYEAVQEMNTIPGAMPKRLADDWNAAAVSRLRADVASISLRSLALLLSSEYQQ